MRGREVQSVGPAAEEGEDRLTSGGPVGSSRDYRKGPVTLRRGLVPHSTTDQRLLDSRGPSDWVHTDPWRVLRIQSEFVEGFGALAELGPAVSVFGSARTRRDRSRLRARRAARREPSSRPGTPSSPAAAPARWRPPTGGLRGRRRLGRARHRAALRAGHQRVGRPRRQLPLLLRPQDDVRQVRPGLRRAARRLRHPRRAVRGARPGPDPQGHVVPDRAARHALLAGPARLAARHGAAPRGKISAPDLELLNVTDDVDEAVALLVDSRPQREHERRSTQAAAAAAAIAEGS